MKAKKISALLLICSMTFSLLTGCSDKKESAEMNVDQEETAEEMTEDDTGEAVTSKGITFPLEEPVTLTAFICTADGAQYSTNDSLFWQYMEERTNVHWEFIEVPFAELPEKKGIVLNSGDYPDVFIGSDVEGADFETGAFINIEDLIKEYGPNISARLDAKKAWDAYRADDGGVYQLARLDPMEIRDPFLFVNETWLQNLGLEKPETKEEFYEVLKAFKEQDADGDGDPNNEIPLIMANDTWYTTSNWPNYFGINSNGTWGYYALSEDEEEVYLWPACEKWKEALGYLHTLYEEGLLYSESFNITGEQLQALGQSGEAIGCFFDYTAAATVGSSYTGDGRDDEYDIIPPFNGYKYSTGDGLNGGVYAVTDACENPEIAIAWADLLYTDEIAVMAELGFEGETYEITEDGKWKWIKDEYGDDVSVLATFDMNSPTRYPGYSTDFYLYDEYVEPDDVASVKLSEYKSWVMENNMLNRSYPRYFWQGDERETVSLTSADIDPYWRQYRAQVITGLVDLESSWDEYLKSLDNMGLSDLEGCMNAAYDRTK